MNLSVYTCFLAPELLRKLIGSLAPPTPGVPPPAPSVVPAPSCGHLLCCPSRCILLSISPPPPPSSLPAPPLPPPPAPNLPWLLPGRQADTRQIGIRERKGGKATRQPGNKGAIKAAPKWRAKDASARKSESELAITPKLNGEGDTEEGT